MSNGAAESLLSLLSALPDPRGRKGLRHPFVAMIVAIVCGVLTGARGYLGISEWLRDQHESTWHWLGFKRKPPCANCFRNLLMMLSPDVLEGVLRRWMASILGEQVQDVVLQAVSIDGKTLCHTLTAHQRNVQLLALLNQRTGCVLSQQAVPSDTNEAKAALELLKTLVLRGQIIIGDAMFCQRDLCQQIIDSGGDYLFVVKDNQPELKEAIAADFQPAFSPDQRTAA
jgi:hypothetical protein